MDKPQSEINWLVIMLGSLTPMSPVRDRQQVENIVLKVKVKYINDFIRSTWLSSTLLMDHQC